MANTGYTINPKVIQVFTSGPSSGSIVSPSFTVTFNSGSGFISSSLCGQYFYNKIHDPYNCVVPLLCVAPILHPATSQFCDSSYNYTYQFNIEAGSNPISGLRVEYCLNSGFTGEVKGTTVTDYSGSIISPLSVNISNGLTNRSETSSSGLVTLPLNQYSPVYFRAKSICSGSNSSSYSNITSGSCPIPPSPKIRYQRGSNTSCYSEVTIKVETTIPVKLNITSTFFTGASYYLNSGYISSNIVNGLVSTDTLYNLGISAQDTGIATNTSLIYCSINDVTTGVVIDSFALTRAHAATPC